MVRGKSTGNATHQRETDLIIIYGRGQDSSNQSILENNTIRFDGSLGINCDLKKEMPILIGCSDINSITKFEADFAGKPVSHERGYGAFL